MDAESSRTSEGDFEEGDIEDYEDEEDTLDEEEELFGKSGFDQTDELRLLNEESELSIEELRRRYLCDVNVEDSLPDFGQATSSKLITTSKSDKQSSGKTSIFTKSSEKSHSDLAYLTSSPLKGDDEEGDEDYNPPTENWKNVIRVGLAYQASKLPVPADYENSDLPLLSEETIWVPPPPSSDCTSQKIKEYLSDCEFIRYKSEHHNLSENFSAVKLNPSTSKITDPSKKSLDDIFDDENALFALYCLDYDFKLAKKQAPFDWPSIVSVNGPRLTYRQPWKQFTQEECEEFEQGIRTYGKNFFQISSNIMNHRRTSELIRFYYTWKKTERYDMFMKNNAERTIAIANAIVDAFTNDSENLEIEDRAE